MFVGGDNLFDWTAFGIFLFIWIAFWDLCNTRSCKADLVIQFFFDKLSFLSDGCYWENIDNLSFLSDGFSVGMINAIETLTDEKVCAMMISTCTVVQYDTCSILEVYQRVYG